MSIKCHYPEDDTDGECKGNDPDLISFLFHDRMLNACCYAMYQILKTKTDETSWYNNHLCVLKTVVLGS